MGAGGRGARRVGSVGAREARVVQETTRRRVLAAAAAALPLVVSGCKGIGALGTPPKPAPDVAVVRDAMAAESYLIARYGAVLAAVPGLAGELRPLLAQHHEHLARLHARLVIPRAYVQPTASPKPTPAPAPVPGTAAGALTYLGDAENAAATSLLAHLGRPRRPWRSCSPASPPPRQRTRSCSPPTGGTHEPGRRRPRSQ